MNLVRSFALCLGLAWVFDRLKVPGGPMIGAMVGATILNLSGTPAEELPRWLDFGVLALLGWSLGGGITPATLSVVRANLVPIGLVAGGLIVCGAAISVLLRRGGVDPGTAFLAAAPGGMVQMAGLSASVGADAAVVATAHLVRLVAVIVIAPFVLKWLDS